MVPTDSLPILYLGLPLTTKSMTAHDYAPLVDKIQSCLLSWTSKFLSYAGRLQLISLSFQVSQIAGTQRSVYLRDASMR